MRTNFRKVLALMLSVLMLCTLLPMGMLSVSAETVVYNADFENASVTGWYTSGSGAMTAVSTSELPVANAACGNYVMKKVQPDGEYSWQEYQTGFTVKANTDYVATVDVLTTSNNWPIQAFVSSVTWISNPLGQTEQVYCKNSEWTTLTFEFNSGNNTKLYPSVKSVWQNTTLYVDNFKIVEKEVGGGNEGGTTTEAPVLEKDWNDGVLGFDKGSVVTGGPDGSQCFKWDATGSWSSTKITVSPIEKDVNYVIKFKAKAASATSVYLTFEDTSWYEDNYFNETVKVTTEWAEYTVTTVAGLYCKNGSIYFKFQDTGAANTFWIDDLTIAKEVVNVPDDPEVPAAGDNLVVNGSFENGNEGWKINSHGAIVSGGYTGSAFQMSNPTNTYEEIGYQEVAVEAHETYTLTWRSKRVSGTGIYNMTIANAPWVQNNPTPQITGKSWMDDTSGNWIEHKLTIKMTDDNGNGISKIMIKLTSEETNSGVILIDDIVLTKNLTASFDGYIYNGDFEIGNTDNWTGYNGTAASTAAAYSGSYGAHLKGNGSYGGILYQNTVNVVAGKTYVVSFYIKVVANGMNIQIKDGNQNGSAITSKGYGVGDWKLVEIEVTPSQNGFCINFCGQGSSSSAVAGKEESAYVDDITVKLKGGNPEEKVEYTGSSVRDEDATGDKTGKGLAFRFTVSAIDGVKTYENKYEENSGKVVLGDQKYTLVRMGAVMTNNATVGQNAANFNLGAVDGKKIIDIPAVYLCGADAESLSFAVRIMDIPDKHIGTAIYARPYYVYLENGEEITVYGATRSNNYAKAANISTADKTKPIKILSIGHSFSKDVMTTNLYNMFMEGGYTDVTIGYLYMAGCSMPKHLYNIQNNLAQYEYAKNSTGTWVTKNNVKALTALQEEDWDFVTVQSSPDYIGGQTIDGFSLGVDNKGDKVTIDPMTEYEAMGEITDWILENTINPDVKIDYHMIWSFSQDCELWSGMYHKDSTGKYNQMTMWQNIVNITQSQVKDHEDINRVIPSATAIQNVRSSFMGDTFNMPAHNAAGEATDGYHLNDYGDYVAALTWYCHYSGDNANIMAGYLGDGSVLSLTTDEFAAIAEAVNNAIDAPYAVTESTHK